MAPRGPTHEPRTPGVARERAFEALGARALVEKLAPGLHIVATPIGNLRDITLRALETLAGADSILAEDTRTSRKLLDHYGIDTPLYAYHEHNAAEARPRILALLAEGPRAGADLRRRNAADF